MIYLSFYKQENRLAKASFDQLLQSIPIHLQDKILKFRNWQDAERSLAGKIMLMRGLRHIGRNEYSLNDLKYSEFQKPFFDESIHFNISHSGNYIICAISEINQIGVDVEELNEIPMDDFTNLFDNREWEEVISAENKFRAFYTLWTKKEAFLKLIGCGLNQPLNEVAILNNRLIWENKELFLSEIALDSQHIAYLCTDVISPVVQVQEIHL